MIKTLLKIPVVLACLLSTPTGISVGIEKKDLTTLEDTTLNSAFSLSADDYGIDLSGFNCGMPSRYSFKFGGPGN